MMTIAPGATSGPSIDSPQFCDYGKGWSGGAWVRVHGRGKRHFDFVRRDATDCDKPDVDVARCPTISIHVFAQAVRKAIVARFGPDSGGVGLGVCGDAHSGLDRWNISSRVFDWAEADDALRIVDDQLRAYDLADDYGLSISGTSCSVPL